MDDFKKLKEAKSQCLADITTHLPNYANRLNAFDARLMAYITDAISNDGSHANLYELLGIRRELRLMDAYELSTDRVHRSLRAIEGIWNRDGWQRGGLKFDTPRGNQHVRLMPYQVWCLFGIYGFLTNIDMERPYVSDLDLLPTEYCGENGNVWDKRRLTDEADIFQTRKSGKTEWGAAIDFTEVSSLGPANAQVVICANSSEQAQIAFKAVKNFAYDIDPTCLNRMGGKFFRVSEKSMKWQPGYRMKGEVRPLTAGSKASKRKDGWYAYIVHAEEHGSADYTNGHSDMQSLVEVMWGSTGPRREKLLLHTTTAGLVKDGPYKHELEQVVEPMLLRELDYPLGELHRTDDDNRFSFLLRLDPWEITDELDKLNDNELFKKVNRSIGTTVQPDYYRKRLHKASHNEDTKQEVLTKDFNIWQIGQTRDWLNPEEIRAIQIDRRVDDCPDRLGWIVFAGMDFSKGDDLNGSSFLCYNTTTGEFFADMDVYMSEEAVQANPIRELLYKWAADGWLTIVPGKTFDPSWPINRVVELDSKGVNFGAFGYDPYNAKTVVNAMSQWVFDIGGDPKQIVVPVRQNFATYSPAVKELDYMIKRSRDDGAGHQIPDPMIHLSMNPLWPYCFGCCTLAESTDGMENFKPIKKDGSAATKVDPVQMLLTGLILYDQAESQIK